MSKVEELRKAMGGIPLDKEMKKAVNEGIDNISEEKAEEILGHLEKVAAALPALEESNKKLQELLERKRKEKLASTEWLTGEEVADLLDITSTDMITYWLEEGNFPGALCTPEGEWRFDKSQVLAVKKRVEEIKVDYATEKPALPETSSDDSKAKKITPELLQEFEKESAEMRKEFRERVKKMHDIPIEQLLTPSK